MRKRRKRLRDIIISCFLAFAISIMALLPIIAMPTEEDTPKIDVSAKSAILMEAATGKVLYEKNADEALPPASVTKVMTLLLVMEALESKKISLDDMVRASANACSMGGSQIFLKENERSNICNKTYSRINYCQARGTRFRQNS